MTQFLDKVVVVTGGSRGIGAAIAHAFGISGARVVITYSTKVWAARKVAERIARAGSQSMILRMQVNDEPSVRNGVKAILGHFGTIDILVNNAGVWKRAPIGKMTEKEWNETLDINLKGTYLLCNAVAPIMKRQRAGKIINIASTAGQRGEAFYSHYAASKGGVIAFTKSIAVELAPYNVLVNCVAPGWVVTDMTASALGDKKRRKKIEAEIPRRKLATPRDIAGPVLFLASDLSDHLVGAVINVNGGSVLS
jgi:3-oxoacyl-[acyl-carrier protein] reductase